MEKYKEELLADITRPLTFKEHVMSRYYPNATASEILEKRKQDVERYNKKLSEVYNEIIMEYEDYIKKHNENPFWEKRGFKSEDDFKAYIGDRFIFQKALEKRNDCRQLQDRLNVIKHVNDVFLKLYISE